MPLVLFRAGLRHLGRHPWPAGLAVLGIALGVAVVVAIDLANESARRAFALSAAAVTGQATHQVVGGPEGLDERLYVRLRLEGGVRAAAPVLEAYVAMAGAPARTLQLLGVDPLAERPFRPYFGGPAGPGLERLARLLTEPGAVLLARETAAGLGLGVGTAAVLRVGGARRPVRVVGLIDPEDGPSRQAVQGLVVADLATAQELTGQRGRLSRIDLVLPDDEAAAPRLARIRALLPPGADVVRAAGRSAFVEQVTRAFSVNLGALSLLALVVGLFLVHNTVTFSVVQRRASLGMLRAVGVTRGEIFVVLVAEILVVGLLATGAGLGLGVLLARGLVRLVTRTINDLYFVLAVRDLALTPLVLGKGAALGIGATLAAALGPALEATGVAPGVAVTRASLEARARRRAPRVALAGIGVLGAGSGLLLVSARSLAWSYAGLFALLLGFALLTPAAVVGLAGLAQPAMGRALGVLGRLAARDVVRSLSRTSVAIAALMIAVAATVGVDLMVSSFRQTVDRWLAASLVADVYVSAPGPVGSRADGSLDPGMVARLGAVPGVEAVGTYRRVRVASTRGPTQLVALGVTPRSRGQFRFVEGSPAAAWRGWAAGEGVIVSEPYAYRHGIRPGATLTLRTDRGERPFPVLGVFADYGSDQGVVMLSRSAYDAAWDDRGVSSIALFAAPGVDVAALVERLRTRAGPDEEVLIRSNRALRQASLEIFDRTFAITAVLRLLAAIVAAVGILSALMALQLERARDLATLRVEGLTPAQVGGLVCAETGLMGAIAGLLAAPVGIVLALVLIRVINRRSFGWTLEAVITPGALLQAVGVAVLVAVLAGLYPAVRMGRTAPGPALREE